MNEIKKPLLRSLLRQKAGKEFYILKRKFNWLFGGKEWASLDGSGRYNHLVYQHKSVILRKLLGVDMQLQENKRTNLKLAIEKINMVTILPGQTFSIWKLVGRPSKKKGYLDGLVLKQGAIDKGTGGGLCQLGNLLFWIFAHSPLDITERYRHGYDVFPDNQRKVPFGSGATLSYNYIDLQAKNNTQNAFQIKLWLDKTHLHAALHSKDPVTETFEIEERNHIIKQQAWGGYSRHNQIFKKTTDTDSVEHESLLVENHAIMMYNPFLEKSGST